MDEWTREEVEARLIEAAEVLKRLPRVRVPGYFSTWPEPIVEFADRVDRAPEPLRRPPPDPAAITRMEEAITWQRFLEPELGKLVWARAAGKPWKAICWRFGIARATAHRRWEYALCLIAWRLNGQPPPTTRSRAFVVGRVRNLSR